MGLRVDVLLRGHRAVVFECVQRGGVMCRYVELIYKILKPGGYWINLGPLLYHWQVEEVVVREA